jgi:hypothetical protein
VHGVSGMLSRKAVMMNSLDVGGPIGCGRVLSLPWFRPSSAASVGSMTRRGLMCRRFARRPQATRRHSFVGWTSIPE